MIRNIFLKIAFLTGLILVLSCTKKDPISDPLIMGLATPFQLKSDTTCFYLSDYVLDWERIDSIHFPTGILSQRINDSVFNLIKIQKIKPLSVIRLYASTDEEDILLINRKKEKVVIQYLGNEEFKNLKVIGSMNNWNRENTGMEKINGVWQQVFFLEPGIYEYLFYSEGKEFRDPQNKLFMGNNSLIRVGEFLPGKLPFITAGSFNKKDIVLHSKNNTENVFGLWQNKLLKITRQGENYVLKVPAGAKLYKRTFIRAYAYNQKGIGNDILIPLQNGVVVTDVSLLTREDKQTMIMYFLMVDRFCNGDSLNDEPVDDPDILPKANYYGGDLEGVYKKVEDGYFTRLGVNTIWLSPISQNPKGAYGLYPDPHTKFSGYHGYWPVSNIRIDYRFGAEKDLQNIVRSAHDRHMNILLDYVANHIHQEHPVYKKHPDWATNLYLPDGSLNTERWDEHRLTTWFDTFLPTLDLRRKEVVDAMADSAVFWVKEYHIDGFRHDATKHIDELYWRTLTRKVKQLTKGKSFYQIGETYGSPKLISSYISSGMLDAQFDFNTYDNAVACFALPGENFSRLKNVLSDSWKYYGYNNLMGNISGNQDRARFISYTGGDLGFDEDAKYAGWKRNIGVGSPDGYEKLKMLHAFNMTIPGIPVIYYGDEIGMPGGNDPDNRRMMRFSGLNEKEKDVKNTVGQLTRIREQNMALLYGQTEILQADQEIFAFLRTYFNNKILVIFNKGKEIKSLKFGLNISPSGLVPEFGSKVEKSGQNITVEIKPLSFDIIHF
jgi:cyclomaltodextrinase / maltogenic alpha-amylase / neopullulanase